MHSCTVFFFLQYKTFLWKIYSYLFKKAPPIFNVLSFIKNLRIALPPPPSPGAWRGRRMKGRGRLGLPASSPRLLYKDGVSCDSGTPCCCCCCRVRNEDSLCHAPARIFSWSDKMKNLLVFHKMSKENYCTNKNLKKKITDRSILLNKFANLNSGKKEF